MGLLPAPDALDEVTAKLRSITLASERLGPADKIDPRVESLGKSFAKVKREALVV